MTETITPPEFPKPVTEPYQQFQNYWGGDETVRFMFPDRQQWVEYRIMDEGAKSKYQQKTNRDITLQRSGDTKIGIDPATDRHILIKSCVIGWNLWKPKDPKDPETEWEEVDFGPKILETWLEKGDPKIVQDLETDIRMHNPWMQADMTEKEIDTEIERLEEVRTQLRKREAEKEYSGTK